MARRRSDSPATTHRKRYAPTAPGGEISDAEQAHPPSLAEIIEAALGEHDQLAIVARDEQGRDRGMAVHATRGQVMVVRSTVGWVLVSGLGLEVYGTPLELHLGYDAEWRQWSVFMHVAEALTGAGTLHHLANVPIEDLADLKRWLLRYRDAWQPVDP